MKKLDIRLLRMIRHSKGQFISVSVIIAIALCIYIAFSMTSINVADAVKHYYKITNLAHINIQLVKIPESKLKEIKQIQGVKEVTGRISFDVPLRVENEDEKVTIRLISIPEDKERINKLFMLSGNKNINESKTIMLDQFSIARKIKEDDIIKPYINGREYELTVSGTAASPEFVYLMENEQTLLPAPEKFGVAYISEDFAQSAYGYAGSYNEILITVYDENQIDDISDKIEKELDEFGVKRIIKRENLLSNKMLEEKIKGIDKMSSVVPVLFLMVAALIISIMLSRIVNNDRTTIGVLKALGFGNIKILSHYTKYALAIGISGSLIGIGSGLMFARFLTKTFIQYFNIPIVETNIYYQYLLYAIILTSIFCIVSGLLGARSVLRILPAESMRPEAPKAGKRIVLERFTFIWRRITFSWKMVIRNIFRTKKRFIFLVLGLSLAYSINTVPVYQVNAMTSMFVIQYGEYQKMDYSIDFRKPASEKALGDIKNIVKVSRIEPKIEYPFEIKNGWRKKTVGIIGVPKDTSFYEFRDKNDAIIKLQENEVIITDALAKILKAKKGDRITIRNFIPGKDDITLRVSDISKQYLGINAYMDIGTMNALLVDDGMITGVLLNSDENIKDKLKDAKNISGIQSVLDMKNSFLQYMDTIIIASWFYMLFGGILGFAIVYNATIIGISERSMEFASLRVLGFDIIDIYKMIAKENIIMTIIAIILGIPLGIGMIRSMAGAFSSELITFPIIIEPRIFALAALASIVFVVLAQLATYKKIRELNFIDSLKSRIS